MRKLVFILGINLIGLSLLGQGDLKTDFITETAGCNATDVSSCGLEYNATQDAQLGMSQITSQTPTIAKVGVAVVIIGMIVGGFGVYFLNNR